MNNDMFQMQLLDRTSDVLNKMSALERELCQSRAKRYDSFAVEQDLHPPDLTSPVTLPVVLAAAYPYVYFYASKPFSGEPFSALTISSRLKASGYVVMGFVQQLTSYGWDSVADTFSMPTFFNTAVLAIDGSPYFSPHTDAYTSSGILKIGWNLVGAFGTLRVVFGATTGSGTNLQTFVTAR